MFQKLFFVFCLYSSFMGFSQSSFQLDLSLQQIAAFLETDEISIQQINLVAGDIETQVALVSNGVEGADFEIDDALFFSTGNASTDLSDKNQVRNRSVSVGNYIDEDLLAIEENAFYDPVIIEFEIQLSPNVNTLTFSYQFGSEEYPDYVGSVYNDVFAIFFKEADEADYQNIALIPNSLNPVAVNFVNGGVLGAASTLGQEVDLTQTDYYTNNGHLNTGQINPVNQPGPFPVHIEYNGITKKLSSSLANLTSETTYYVKFALADTADPNFDSGVLFSPILASFNEVALHLEKDGEFTSLSNENRAEVGDEITYFFKLTNTGDFSVFDLTFEDEMFPNANPFQQNSVIEPGEVIEFQLTYAITQNDINNGFVHNLASVSGLYSVDQTYTISSIDPTPLPEDHPLKDEDCLDCTSVLVPQDIQLALIKKGTLELPSKPSEVGDKVLYTFDVHNLGNVDLFDIQIHDPLPSIEMEEISFDVLSNHFVEDATYATYNLTINDIRAGEVENQAFAIGFTTLNEEATATSDFESVLLTRPTVVPLNSCELEIYDAITPNGDGINDFLFIEGVSCFPENNLQIFNRWGVKVFSAENYDNQTNVFEGVSNGRATIAANQSLPDGVYYYVFQYIDLEGASATKKGSIYVTKGR